jgi:hypothetical protein
VVKVTVAGAYLTAAVEAFARDDGVALALAGLVAAAAGVAYLRTSGTARRAGVPALVAALALAGALALGAVSRLAGWEVDRGILLAYDAVVAGAVLVLLGDLLRGRWADAVVTDLVVDLGGRADTGTLRDELGRALGDRTLVLGYCLPDEARYADDAGSPVDPDAAGAGRVVTPIEADGEPVAVLVHDAAVLDDTDLVEAVAAAARLAVSNARLQADAANGSSRSPRRGAGSSRLPTPSAAVSSVSWARACNAASTAWPAYWTSFPGRTGPLLSCCTRSATSFATLAWTSPRSRKVSTRGP